MKNEKFNLQRSFIASIPYIALVLGMVLFIYGTFGTFEYPANKEFVSGFGKTILASGIFALLLKTVQFLGVFKEELSKVIYDPRFLANRKDLLNVWEETSKVLFKNKFPGLSKRLLKDITENYFPSEHNYYYENLEHFISIKHNGNSVEVSYNVNLILVSNSLKEKCLYESASVVSFKEARDEIEVNYKYIKVDDSEQKPEIKQDVKGKQLITRMSITLQGKESYKIDREELRKYNLDNDNILYFRASKLTNNLSVTLEHPSNITVDFKKCGTILDFNNTRNTGHIKQYKYNGILYPEQGYIITLNKS
jgi:hypothetical protein